MISPCVCDLYFTYACAHVLVYILLKLLKNQFQVLSKPTIWLTCQECCFLLISSFLPTFPIHSSLHSESWETDPCELPFSASCQPALGLARGWRAGGKRAQDRPPLLSPCRPTIQVITVPPRMQPLGSGHLPFSCLPIKPGEPGFFPNDAHLGVSSHLWWSPWGGPQLCERSLH